MAGLPDPIASGFQSSSAPLAVQYATQGVQPFNALAVTKDTYLVFNITAVVATSIQLNWRVLLPDGRIVPNQTLVTTSNIRILNVFSFPLTDGFLLSVLAVPVGSIGRGQAVVNAHLQVGTGAASFFTMRLFAGYLTFFDFLGWPPGNFESTSAGAGNIRSITGTLPAAGAEISETVPNLARWRLKSFNFSITTSATVANRNPRLVIDDGVNQLTLQDVGISIAASTTQQLHWVPGHANPSNQDNVLTAGLGPETILGPGYRIRTNTLLLQVGDQYTAPQYEVEEWIMV